MIQSFPIIGFAPDLAPTTPGILLDSDQVLPTTRGIRSGMAFQDSFATPLTGISGATLNTSVANLITPSGLRFIAASGAKVLELDGAGGSGPFDISGAATLSALPWAIANVGEIALLTNITNRVLASATDGGALTTVSGAPSGAAMVVCGEPNASFVMVFGYSSDATFANYISDGVWWSALGDYTSWAPSIATQAGNIRLQDVSGAFTNAIAYRDGVVAWKKRAMYLGSYVEGAAVWAWQTVSKNIGCPWLGGAVVGPDDILYFASDDGLWTFDGSYPRPAPGNLHRWWRTVMPYNGGIKLHYSHLLGLLFVSYNDFNGPDPTRRFLAFHPRSGIWTRYGLLKSASSTAYAQCMTADADYGITTANPTQMFHLNTFTASEPAYTDATYTMHALGNVNQMTTLRAIRPDAVVGPDANTADWMSARVFRASTLRHAIGAYPLADPNLAASGYVDFSYRAPGALDGMISDRFLVPRVSIAANATHGWEIVSNDLDIFADGTA